MFRNRNQILRQLLDLSQMISNYATMYRVIDDMSYNMQVNFAQSQFGTIVGYENIQLLSMLSSRIQMINANPQSTNSIKLLELSSAILQIGNYVR